MFLDCLANLICCWSRVSFIIFDCFQLLCNRKLCIICQNSLVYQVICLFWKFIHISQLHICSTSTIPSGEACKCVKWKVFPTIEWRKNGQVTQIAAETCLCKSYPSILATVTHLLHFSYCSCSCHRGAECLWYWYPRSRATRSFHIYRY